MSERSPQRESSVTNNLGDHKMRPIGVRTGGTSGTELNQPCTAVATAVTTRHVLIVTFDLSSSLSFDDGGKTLGVTKLMPQRAKKCL